MAQKSTMINYVKIGFKAGLEIHAQIDSHKLFCNCPSILRQDPPDEIIRRELRPLAGETGEIDVAALYERKKYKKYIYEYYSDTNCELEIDECPPYSINEEALTVALTVAKLLHCNFPDTIQVMRKTVIDGSNTSGFQRTVLVGLDGWLETTFGKVGINFLILEEDAGRRVAEDKKSVTYRLDRLGIPMLEIVTAPDMKTPDQVAEVARKLGLLVRATGKAMRGIGTVRQDVNVSIKGHCRVEMKGVQDLRLMHKYIDVEIERQKTSKDEVPHVRNVKPDFTSKYLRPLPGAARMYPETDIPLIHLTKERISKIKLPETHEEKLGKFKKLGLSDNLAKQLATHKKVALFEELASKYKVNPTIIADTVLSIESRVRKEIGKEVKFSKEKYHDIFELLSKNKIVKESVFDVFVQLAKTGKIDLSKFKTLSDTDLKKEIDKLLKEHKNAPENKITGIIIGQLRGKAEPKKIIEILKKK